MKLFSSISSLVLLIGLAYQQMWSAPIRPKLAIEIAQHFFSGSLRSVTSNEELKITYIAPELNEKNEFRRATSQLEGNSGLYYVINRGQNNGFIIIAGDDRVNPILAYSETGSINCPDLEKNINLRYILGSYTRQMRYAIYSLPDRSHQMLRTGANIPSQEVVVEPLLNYNKDRRTRLPQTLAWGQAWPFNNYAPNITINESTYPTVAGCVATAISTVMRWHRWPHHPKGSLGYNWRGYYLSTKLDGSSYNWDQMPTKISANGVDYETGYLCTKQNADNIGRLLRDVAYAVRMNYDAAFRGGSGANPENILVPFARNFGYKNQVRYLYRNDYTAKTWWNEVTDELRNYGPVIYVGYGSGGGHCFVLDGYARLNKENDYFVHVDWGWTGNQNGWYKIDVMEPGALGIGGGSGGGFANHQAMIRYLQPDPKWEKENPQPTPEPHPDFSDDTDAFKLRIKDIAKASVEEDGKIVIPTTLHNEGTGKFDAILKVYASPVGIDPLSQAQEIDNGQIIIDSKASLKINLELNLSKITPKLKAGKYNIYLAYPSKKGYYMYVRTSKDAPAVCAQLEVTKKKGLPQPQPIVEPKFSLSIAKLWGGTLEPTAGQKVDILLKNTGNKTYTGKLALCLAKTEQDLQSLIIAEENASIAPQKDVSVNFNIDLTDKQEGDYKLYVAFYNGTRYKSIEEVAGVLTIEKKNYKIALYSTPIEFQAYLHEKLTIHCQLSNFGKINYNNTLGLYAVEQGKKIESSTLLIQGKALLEAEKNTTVNFHPLLDNLKENQTYDLYLTYINQNGTNTYLTNAKGEAIAIGSLYIRKKATPKPTPITSTPIFMDRVNIYQNGEYKGSSAPYIHYENGKSKFSARIYLNPQYDFSGKIRLVLVNPNGQTPSVLEVKSVSRNIKITKATKNGYVDAVFTTAGLSDSYYYLVLQYYNPSSARWISTGDKFLFLINYTASSLGEKDNLKDQDSLTQGETYRIDSNNAIHIGDQYSLEPETNLVDNTDEELEDLRQEYSIYPSVTRNLLTLNAKNPGIAIIYDLTGRLIHKFQVQKGVNTISTSMLVPGSYTILIGKKKLRFIRK